MESLPTLYKNIDGEVEVLDVGKWRDIRRRHPGNLVLGSGNLITLRHTDGRESCLLNHFCQLARAVYKFQISIDS